MVIFITIVLIELIVLLNHLLLIFLNLIHLIILLICVILLGFIFGVLIHPDIFKNSLNFLVINKFIFWVILLLWL